MEDRRDRRHAAARQTQRRRRRRRGLGARGTAVLFGLTLGVLGTGCLAVSPVAPIVCGWCSGTTVRVLVDGKPVADRYVWVDPAGMYARTDAEGRLLVPSVEDTRSPLTLRYTEPFPDDPYCAYTWSGTDVVPLDSTVAFDFPLLDTGALCA